MGYLRARSVIRGIVVNMSYPCIGIVITVILFIILGHCLALIAVL
jgi:hypothetical protein